MVKNAKATTVSRAKSDSKLSRISSNKHARMSIANRTTATSRSSAARLTRKEMAAEQENIKKNGTRRIKLRVKCLFAGFKVICERLDNEIDGTLDDCFISVKLENQFMSEDQLYELNPFCIRLDRVVNLPSRPLDYEDLKNKCEPVYLSYKFFDQPIYKSIKIGQDKNLYFNDINVFLLGTVNKPDLKEYLYKSFEIEVHDRDRNQHHGVSLKPCLFGNDETLDENISSVSLAASKHTMYNPFEIKNKYWDPYGVAKVSLNELILGKRMLEMGIPVLPCDAPDVLGRSNSSKNSSNKKTLGHEDSPLQAGEYLDSNTQLDVTMWVAKPIFNDRVPSSRKKKNKVLEQDKVRNAV